MSDSTTNSKTQQITTQNVNNPFSNLNMTDLFVNNVLLSKFGEVLNGNYELSPINIVKLLVLTNLSSIKKLLNSSFTESAKLVKSYLVALGLFILTTYRSIREPKEKEIENIKEKEPEIKDYFTREVTVNNQFIMLLYKYITNVNLPFTISVVEYDVKNKKEIMVKKKLEGIEIEKDDFTFRINTDIFYFENEYTNEISQISLKNDIKYTKQTDKSAKTRYIDYLNPTQRKGVLDAWKEMSLWGHRDLTELVADETISIDTLLRAFFRFGTSISITSDQYINEYHIAKVICKNHPELDLRDTVFTICIISAFYYKKTQIKFCSKLKCKVTASGLSYFYLDFPKPYPYLTLSHKTFCFQPIKNVKAFDNNNCFNMIPQITINSTNASKSTQNNSNKLIFSVKHPDVTNYHIIENKLLTNKNNYIKENKDVPIELKNEMENNKVFKKIIYDKLDISLTNLIKIITKNEVLKVDPNDKKKVVPIELYKLNFEYKVTEDTQPNDKYDEWREKMDILSGKNDDEDDNENENKSQDDENNNKPKRRNRRSMMNNRIAMNLFNMDAPPKTITTKKYEPVITTEKINSVNKSVDNLYLRKFAKKYLLSALDQFKNKKEKLRQLSLPIKLNVLLYGPPGTGKTTTIQTIASYLQRNIYYVNLKEAKTNKDIQMIFNHVNKNATSGLIVLEDIDAMTNVVHKRSEEVEELSINDLGKKSNEDFSLEYLLNILDGVLTLEDSIVIVTTNHFEKLDPAFTRPGRFDLKIELEKCDRFQIQEIFFNMMDRNIDETLLKFIPENEYTPAQIIYHIKNYLFGTENDYEIMMDFIPKEEKDNVIKM